LTSGSSLVEPWSISGGLSAFAMSPLVGVWSTVGGSLVDVWSITGQSSTTSGTKLPWLPLAGGFLSGKYDRGVRPEGSRLARWNDAFKRFDNDRGWGLVDTLRAVAAEVDATPAQVALAWTLHKPGVTSVIFGARSVAQLDDNLPAGTLALSPEQVARLEAATGFEIGYPYDFIQGVQKRW